MISVKQKGDFSKTFKFLKKNKKISIDFDKYGREGVRALSLATPKDTGLTADSWSYRILKDDKSIKIEFLNSNIQNGIPVAILLQYGHATKNGGWIEGIDYINPAIQPIFDKIAKEAWKEVSSK